MILSNFFDRGTDSSNYDYGIDWGLGFGYWGRMAIAILLNNTSCDETMVNAIVAPQ